MSNLHPAAPGKGPTSVEAPIDHTANDIIVDPEDEHPKGVIDEKRLLHDLKRATANTRNRWMVRVHLSLLGKTIRTDQALRATEAIFTTLVSRKEAHFYWLRCNDFVVLFNLAHADVIRSSLIKVRFLFAGDPIIDAHPPASGLESDAFSTWWQLDKSHNALLSEIRALVAEHRSGGSPAPRRRSLNGDTVESDRQGAPLTPGLLTRVETALMGADLSSHIRRQPICAVVGQAPPDPVFTEVFVSIGDLREAMLPHINLASNPWLFQHLTQTLDRRVLAMLTRRDDKTLAQGFSINLNVSTILSEDFLRFDDSLAPGSHGTVVVELRSEDIFADLNAFFFARDFIRQRGYRLCVDGLSWQALPFVDPNRLGVDLMKLSWAPDLPAALGGEDGHLALDVIRRLGHGKIILARCDSAEAITYGQSMGLTLFQGRHLDQIMKAHLLM